MPDHVRAVTEPAGESVDLAELAGTVLDPTETRMVDDGIEDRVRDLDPGHLGNMVEQDRNLGGVENRLEKRNQTLDRC